LIELWREAVLKIESVSRTEEITRPVLKLWLLSGSYAQHTTGEGSEY
jgi:hypothetical protein